MPEFYQGQINKLVIVAGPAASGKSTFLANPMQFITREQLPDALAGLPERAPEHSHLIRLHRRTEPSFHELYLHVDILRPLMCKLETLGIPSGLP